MPEHITSDPAKREKILNGAGTIPAKHLVQYIVDGEVTKSEVIERLRMKAMDDKITELEMKLSAFDDDMWGKALQVNTVESYNEYLRVLPDGLYAKACMMKFSELDEQMWAEVMSDLSEFQLNRYKTRFPRGRHISECESFLGDLPWLETKRENTIMAYQYYMQAHPDRHQAEARQAIIDLEDDTDWSIAEAADNTSAYQTYFQKHPNGKYAAKAQNAINANAGRDKIISDIRENRNAYTPRELQDRVGNKIITWDDLKGQGLYNDAQIEAIKSYRLPTSLPVGIPPETLVKGPTEVFFWGTPSSGKTCALGAILSAAKKYGCYTSQVTPGSGGAYRDMLSNIFDSDEICVFPEGTPDTSIQQMIFTIRDAGGYEHLVNFVDLAGELFRSMFYKINYNSYYEENFDIAQKQALDLTLKYLSDTENKKIHFFIVAYGEERQKWRGEDIRMVDFLSSTMTYLRDQKIIRKGTNGVYILVTKSDNMPCPKEERKAFAERYVKDKMSSFYNSVENICKKAGVRDFEVIPFSVGDVFAQKLCIFDKKNTNEVLDKLILKTPKIREGFVKFLNS